MRLLRVILAMLSMAFVSCRILRHDTPDPRYTAGPRSLWKRCGIRNYRFVLTVGTFEGTIDSLAITVRSDTLAEIVDLGVRPGRRSTPSLSEGFRTIPSMFDWIDVRHVWDPAEFRDSYDAARGYPTYVWCRCGSDLHAGTTYTVGGFRSLDE